MLSEELLNECPSLQCNSSIFSPSSSVLSSFSTSSSSSPLLPTSNASIQERLMDIRGDDKLSPDTTSVHWTSYLAWKKEQEDGGEGGLECDEELDNRCHVPPPSFCFVDVMGEVQTVGFCSRGQRRWQQLVTPRHSCFSPMINLTPHCYTTSLVSQVLSAVVKLTPPLFIIPHELRYATIRDLHQWQHSIQELYHDLCQHVHLPMSSLPVTFVHERSNGGQMVQRVLEGKEMRTLTMVPLRNLEQRDQYRWVPALLRGDCTHQHGTPDYRFTIIDAPHHEASVACNQWVLLACFGGKELLLPLQDRHYRYPNGGDDHQDAMEQSQSHEQRLHAIRDYFVSTSDTTMVESFDQDHYAQIVVPLARREVCDLYRELEHVGLSLQEFVQGGNKNATELKRDKGKANSGDEGREVKGKGKKEGLQVSQLMDSIVSWAVQQGLSPACFLYVFSQLFRLHRQVFRTWNGTWSRKWCHFLHTRFDNGHVLSPPIVGEQGVGEYLPGLGWYTLCDGYDCDRLLTSKEIILHTTPQQLQLRYCKGCFQQYVCLRR
jgi:hypothetical protein